MHEVSPIESALTPSLSLSFALPFSIKPANVLLDNDGRAVLSDFGLVKQLDATNAMASTFVGTMRQ